MARYNVTPVGAGTSQWKVEKNGDPISTHRSQQNAINKARRDSSSGDTLVIHRPSGLIREQKTIR